MSSQRKAIIIGAGPAGLAAALRLHQQTDISCTIYELRPEPTTLGGAVGILPNGLRLLYRLGVYEKALARGFGGPNLSLHSLQGHTIGSQDWVGWAREKTGFGYMRIKRTDLVDVLLEAVNEAKIPIRFNKRLEQIDDNADEVKVIFSDSSTDSADILLGCDGIHSFVRRSYVDPEYAPEYSGLAGLGSVVPTSALTSTTTEQIVGLEATMTEMGMLAVTRCTPDTDELYWFFTKEVALPASGDSRDGWEVQSKEEVEGFKAPLLEILENAQGEWGNYLRDIVSNTSVVKFYPIYRLPPGGTWSKGRCILVGDAAHAMSPHAGQGVSMALEDVFLLSRLLEDPSRPLGQIREKYDAIRKPRANEIYEIAAQNGQLRRRTGPWGLWFKEFVFSMAMNLSWAFGLERVGFGQKHLVYDIDEVGL
ncbi:salicylate hydroxylase [Penicillium argentinense]|uniref:Salicylate hydroxylase n=1 Tax=Penicillium argentinense TaxID=1131581 RepID=A0A9W9FE70_9EURO|nr:salicylate hydroxylase [Penicillium argentinense]KAJ5098547.1 salicylate hydroxylase [Penicillium argentinense]